MTTTKPQNPRKRAANRLKSRFAPPQTTQQMASQAQKPAPMPILEAPPETKQALADLAIPEQIEYEPEPEIKMSPIEKVKFMNALATAAQNEELSEMFMKMDQGELIYGLFVEAINSQLESLMNGDVYEQDEDLAQVYNVAQDCNYIRGTMVELQRLVNGFMGTPLVEVLNNLNTQLGGQRWQPRNVQQPQQYQQQPQQQYPQQNAGPGYRQPPPGGYPPDVHRRPPQQPAQNDEDTPRGSGIGSY